MSNSSRKNNNSQKLRSILNVANNPEYTEEQMFILESLIYGNNPDIVLKITNGGGHALPGFIPILRNAIQKLITKAFNEDQSNLDKISKLSYEKDELLRRNNILSNRLKQFETPSANTTADKSQISELERQLSVAKNNFETLQRKYQKDISERDGKIEELLLQDAKNKKTIESYKGMATSLNADKESVVKEIMGKSVVITELESQNDTLHKQINELSSENKELQTQVKGYERIEKKLLPILLADCYCKKCQGKSIELNKSQIEDVIKYYLNGYSQSKISKELNVSRSTIKKILTCDFSTLSSIEKILSALHSVNGNWTDDRKDKLTVLIKDYEEAKEIVEARKNEIKEDLKTEITSLEDYIEFKKSK